LYYSLSSIRRIPRIVLEPYNFVPRQVKKTVLANSFKKPLRWHQKSLTWERGWEALRVTRSGLLSEIGDKIRMDTSGSFFGSTMEKIVAAFKKTGTIDPEKNGWLIFDGERLEPELTVRKVGFEDQNNIEVYIR
jgi:hypothetical protein